MIYLGDYPVNHTAVCIPFDSFTASTGASSATSGFANTDILIYKDAGLTQRTSAAGIVASTSFDSQTGLNMITIDLSDNTDAGFYAAGHEYQVGVADITIDSQTVRFWAATFSIERAGGILALLKAGTVNVATATNLTNAPTNGDLTAAMKTSVQTAADAAITANALILEIEADTDTLTGFITVAPPTAAQNADKLLGRNVAGGSDGGRIVSEAFYFIRNKWTALAGVLTVYGTDDVTVVWTASLSSDAAAAPITGNDPA